MQNKPVSDIHTNTFNSTDSDITSREQYISTLEINIQSLTKEIENLNKQLTPLLIENKDRNKSVKSLNDIIASLNSCATEKQVINKLHTFLAKNHSILETDFFFYSKDNQLVSSAQQTSVSPLPQNIKQLEQSGVIDWALEKKSISFVPNLNVPAGNKKTFIIILPLFIRKKNNGIFTAHTTKNLDEYHKNDINMLTVLALYTSVILDNLRNLQEVNVIHSQLAMLNDQLLKSSKLSSIGELAGAISQEINTPLSVIKANLNLLETGVGDKKRRIEIIKEQIDVVYILNQRLVGFAETTQGDIDITKINICSLIDEVLLFSASQLLKDGIIIEKDYEDNSLEFLGSKTHIEQAILNLLLFSKDTMPEGGKISIGVFKHQKRHLVVQLADNGLGFPEEEIPKIFDMSYVNKSGQKAAKTGLFITKNIIQQYRGNIRVYSEQGKGTTYKLFFPVYLPDEKFNYINALPINDFLLF